MISMTYARNLARGDGLVWNIEGERVEGYTNLLWVIFMSLFHFLPLDSSKVSLLVQISGFVFLFMNFFYVRKIGEIVSGKNPLVSLGAVFLAAFYLPLVTWSLEGMEVSVLTLLVTICVWQILCSREKSRFPVLPFIILGIGTLIRLDMAVPYIGFFLYLFITRKKQRKPILGIGMAILVFFMLIQTLFRFLYYGELLPNTYYLKMTGIPLWMRIARGAMVFANFAWKANWILFLLPFVILFIKRNRDFYLPVVLIILQILYSIYVGGDSWEWWGGSNRFITIVMPLFFILFSWSLWVFLSMIDLKAIDWKEKYKKALPYIFSLLILACLVNFNAIRGLSGLGQGLFIRPPLHVKDHKGELEKALILKKITTENAHIAVTWGGIPIYFSERRGVDLLGKNDKTLARLKMREISSLKDYNPGHIKRDYKYSIGVLKPDVVLELGRAPEEAEPLLEEHYQLYKHGSHEMYLLNNSNNVLWDSLKK